MDELTKVKFKESQKKIIEFIESGLSIKEIVEKTGLFENYVFAVYGKYSKEVTEEIRKEKIVNEMNNEEVKEAKQLLEEIKQLCRQGVSSWEIQRKFKVDIVTVRKIIAEEIRKLFRKGISRKKLAEKFRLSDTTVKRILGKELEEQELKQQKQTMELSDEKQRKIIELKKSGLTSVEIEEKTEISKHIIDAIWRKETKKVMVEEHIEEIKRLYRKGLSNRELSAKFTISIKTVNKIIREEVEQLYREGVSIGELSEKFRLNIRTVRKIASKIPKTKICIRKDENRTISIGRLTEEQKKEIKHLCKEGWSTLKIAEKFGVSDSTVRRITSESTT